MNVIWMAEIQMAEIYIETETVETAVTVTEMTVTEMDAGMAPSIAGSAGLIAPRKVPPTLVVVDHLIAGVLFATAVIALEEGLVTPAWKRERSVQEQETVSRDPLARILSSPRIPPSVYQSV